MSPGERDISLVELGNHGRHVKQKLQRHTMSTDIESEKNHAARVPHSDDKKASDSSSVPGESPREDSETDHHRERKSLLRLPESLKWIPGNWTWSNVKPVIQCAVAAWTASLLFIVPRVEIWMGQVRTRHLSPHSCH
jgi:hypothetical protein